MPHERVRLVIDLEQGRVPAPHSLVRKMTHVIGSEVSARCAGGRVLCD